MDRNIIYQHDVTKKLNLPDNSVDMCVTSPPYYGLRDYGMPGQIGLEKTPELYIKKLVKVFREVKRVMKPTGTLWLNIGDTYWGGKGKNGQENKSSLDNRFLKGKSINKSYQNIGKEMRPTDRKHKYIKPKDMIGIPWMLAFALQKDGWHLRQDIIWNKKNCMPESVKDRCTKSHEYIFLLTKSPQYYFDYVAIQQPMAEYEMERRLKEKAKGLNSTYDLKRDGKTGLADQSKTGAIRNVSKRAELAENGMANKRSVWTIASSPYQEAHFATFPEDLIVDCIRAGTSEKGNCSKCGKPYIRIITKELVPTCKANKTKTIGWKATCKCHDAEIVKPIVLDIFGGASTTAVTSGKLNRDWIIYELNPNYIKLSNRRLHSTLGLFQ